MDRQDGVGFDRVNEMDQIVWIGMAAGMDLVKFEITRLDSGCQLAPLLAHVIEIIRAHGIDETRSRGQNVMCGKCLADPVPEEQDVILMRP